jgi:hypothetical protein
VVYLIQANQKVRELHRLQAEGISLAESEAAKGVSGKEKGDEAAPGEEGGDLEKLRHKELSMEKIAKMLPGLVAYK